MQLEQHVCKINCFVVKALLIYSWFRVVALSSYKMAWTGVIQLDDSLAVFVFWCETVGAQIQDDGASGGGGVPWPSINEDIGRH